MTSSSSYSDPCSITTQTKSNSVAAPTMPPKAAVSSVSSVTPMTMRVENHLLFHWSVVMMMTSSQVVKWLKDDDDGLMMSSSMPTTPSATTTTKSSPVMPAPSSSHWVDGD